MDKSQRYPSHHLVRTGPIVGCQVCNAPAPQLILDLGHQPLCDTLLTRDELNRPEVTYPLRMMWCATCTAAQLDYCVDENVVFHPDYPYRSGISAPLADYQRQICLSLIDRYHLTARDLVVDVGSNDGTLLSGFRSQGIRHLGVEPTNIARIANAAGIPTIQSFFDIDRAGAIRGEYGPAKIIITTNVFAHMRTIGEMIAGVYDLLADDGVFIAETHYLLDVIAGGQFDTMYHEHLRTYSLRSLITLFEPYDFTLTHVERGDRYGGNIRAHVSKGRGRPVSPQVTALLDEERTAGLDRLETYQRFADRARAARLEFLEFIVKVKRAGQSIVGKSCPGRASTLLNFYGVDRDLLPYLAELPTSLKLGMFSPGAHIPVVDEAIIFREQPDYIVLLAWHYADVIMKRLKREGITGDFVVPLPELQIVRNAQV